MATVEITTTGLQTGIGASRASGNNPKADMPLLLAAVPGTLIPGFTPDAGVLVAFSRIRLGIGGRRIPRSRAQRGGAGC